MKPQYQNLKDKLPGPIWIFSLLNNGIWLNKINHILKY